MFRCTECEKIFDIKPDYCDCGNDLFEEVKDVSCGKNKHSNLSNQGFGFIKEYLERRNISIIALIFFVCSIVFSLAILFIGNGTSDNGLKTNTLPKTANKIIEIPDIDSFWDNKAPETIVVSSKYIKNNVDTKQVLVSKTQQSKVIKNNVVKNTKIEQKQSKPSSSTKKNNAPTNKPVTTTKSTKTVAPTTVTKKQSVQTKPVPVVKQQPKVDTTEMNNYKIALRNALFSKLAITEVVGKGRCGIEFSIDSTGKLIKRAFTFQSDNKSINDEVYKMLMRLPSFYPPPEGYDGAKIKMTFTFDNGSYIIDFTN